MAASGSRVGLHWCDSEGTGDRERERKEGEKRVSESERARTRARVRARGKRENTVVFGVTHFNFSMIKTCALKKKKKHQNTA
jgi:hypothetical protein